MIIILLTTLFFYPLYTPVKNLKNIPSLSNDYFCYSFFLFTMRKISMNLSLMV